MLSFMFAGSIYSSWDYKARISNDILTRVASFRPFFGVGNENVVESNSVYKKKFVKIK